MASLPDNFDLRAVEVQEVLRKDPGLIISWGSIVVFFILAGAFGSLWVAKIPVSLEGKLVLTDASGSGGNLRNATLSLQNVTGDVFFEKKYLKLKLVASEKTNVRAQIIKVSKKDKLTLIAVKLLNSSLLFDRDFKGYKDSIKFEVSIKQRFFKKIFSTRRI